MAAFALEVRDSGIFQILIVQSWLLVTMKFSFSLKGIKTSSVRKEHSGFCYTEQKASPPLAGSTHAQSLCWDVLCFNVCSSCLPSYLGPWPTLQQFEHQPRVLLALLIYKQRDSAALKQAYWACRLSGNMKEGGELMDRRAIQAKTFTVTLPSLPDPPLQITQTLSCNLPSCCSLRQIGVRLTKNANSTI